MSRNISYELSLNILKALGGDVSTPYPDADAVWKEINGIYEETGKIINIDQLVVDVTKNGTYNFDSTDEISGYAPVKVNVNVEGGEGGENLLTKYLRDYANVLGYSNDMHEDIGKVFMEFIDTVPQSPSGNIWQNALQDSKILFAPVLNTSGVTNANNLFYNCQQMIAVPYRMQFSYATTLQNMFANCTALTCVDSIYAPECTHFNEMFNMCYSLKTIRDGIHMNKAANCSRMFNLCFSLENIDLYANNIPSISETTEMFQGCFNLNYINFNNFDFSNLSQVEHMFADCGALTHIDGLINFGAIQGDIYGGDSMFQGCHSLSPDFFVMFFNDLYDRTGWDKIPASDIGIPDNVLMELTEDDIAIATNKGWTILSC